MVPIVSHPYNSAGLFSKAAQHCQLYLPVSTFEEQPCPFRGEWSRLDENLVYMRMNIFVNTNQQINYNRDYVELSIRN